eukprot:jgi/Orpsp1_1/1191676/evm.model.d7180000087723.1
MNKININSYVSAIDNEDINRIKQLNSINIKKNNKDIIFEMYNKKLLTLERLQFIMKNCIKYIEISSNLIKRLIGDKNIYLLNVIFNNLKYYDNEFILNFLLYYKNKKPVSIKDLNQQISNEKYKILIDDKYSSKVNKYLINECNKKDINMNLVKYLVKHGLNINEEGSDWETPLFDACKNGNENIVKYLVEHGADINKENTNGETPLFNACLSGNETLVKYLIEEHGADINKENNCFETPLFNACINGNETVVKYLVEQGADINKK